MAVLKGLLALATMLLTSLLAGCIGDGGGDQAVEAPEHLDINPDLTKSEAARELRSVTEITADSEVGPPVWTVGEWWEWEVFFQGQQEPIVFKAVVQDDASEYVLLTENRDVAMFEALFDIPLLGTFDKATLDTTSFYQEFSAYPWPLHDGKTWTGEFDVNGDGAAESWNYHAALEQIPTPEGTLPGFTIHGMNETGTVLFQYDYVPALHWANHVFFFNAENPEEYDLHVMVQDHGFGYTGDLYVMEATPLVEEERFTNLFPLLGGGMPVVPTDPPVITFDTTEAFTYVAGFYYYFACDGAATVTLVPPSGQDPLVENAVALPPVDPSQPVACNGSGNFLLAPNEPGTWKAVLGGAGVLAGVGLFISGVAETVVTL